MLFRKPDEPQTYALLRRYDNFGIEELDLLRPPRRFWAPSEMAPSGVEMNVDARRALPVPSPSELLAAPPGESWSMMTRRSLARLVAWFLIAEDPQRRLEAQPIVTLAHQASVVQHIREQPSLRRVLLADEVGLGKTVEAALLIKALVTERPSARVLYLAPARLVRNVHRELAKLDLVFRAWVATGDGDARLDDTRVVASIHRACHKGRIDEVLAAPPWDMIVVDECHHLSDWAPGGGSPLAQYKLVQKLAERLGDDGRLLLMSGTPHQGNSDRFRNLLRLLQAKNESESQLAGRVIYRTKEDVRDWDDQPLFPGRRVNPPLVLDLGPEHRRWLADIHELFEPGSRATAGRSAQRRAAGWRAGQALQWATSSVQAGLGYLVRHAIRADSKLASLPGLREAIAAMRPYRRGAPDEPIDKLFKRIADEVGQQIEHADVEDIEEMETEDDGRWRPDFTLLSRLLRDGVAIHRASGDAKWDFVFERVLRPAGDEKVVLFAQPIETVTALAGWLTRKTGQRPALILGGQSEEERAEQIQRFWDPRGPRFLVSSRAGGEGLNLQIARRLVHLDVPWNPMELEQRIGRVHRFLSKQTILVDTIVVKDSREVDIYAYAREKLTTIASTLVPEDRFESLFGRVMSLVPPDELSEILGQGPVGPLSPEERERIADLVTRGFDQWKGFHDRYAKQQKQIRTLDPGQATWADLAAFAEDHLSAKPVEGFTALRFVEQNGEVMEASKSAHVLTIDGSPWAAGDHGGMPVVRDDGVKAEQLGTNVLLMTRALRAHGLPDAPAGAAYVRWTGGAQRPHEGPFGVLVFARQSVRWEQGSYAEHATTLHVCTVTADGRLTPVEARAKGDLVRALVRATVRREAEEVPALLAAMHKAEADLWNELRRPTDADREARVMHAVTPLLAAVIS
ncbi:helicase-related protein [Sorangium sp. So ce1667]